MPLKILKNDVIPFKRKDKLPRQTFRPKYETVNFYYPRPTPQDTFYQKKKEIIKIVIKIVLFINGIQME